MKLFSFWRLRATYRVRIALNLKGLVPDEVVDVTYEGRAARAGVPRGQPDDDASRFDRRRRADPVRVAGDHRISRRPAAAPRDARGRARVRGLAQIVACDSHPLIVPRVREYLEHEFKLDEPTRVKWCQHWHTAVLTALEAHLKDAATALSPRRRGHARRHLHSRAKRQEAKFFSVDTAPFSNFTRIANSLSTSTLSPARTR